MARLPYYPWRHHTTYSISLVNGTSQLQGEFVGFDGDWPLIQSAYPLDEGARPYALNPANIITVQVVDE